MTKEQLQELTELEELEALEKSYGDKLTPKAPMQAVSDKIEPAISNISSFGQGALDAGSLGFSDELGAGIQTGLDLGQSLLNRLGLASESPSQVDTRLASQGFTGDLTPSSKDVYEQSLKQNRQALKQAEESNPEAFLAGQVTGGLAQGLAGGGLLAKMGITGASTAGLPLLARMGVGAAAAAPQAAVYGAGSSEGSLIGDEKAQQQLKSDVINAATTGGLIGGAIPGVGAGIGKIADVAADSPFLRQLAKSFRLGSKEGIDIASEADQIGKLAGKSGEKSKELVDRIVETNKALGEDVGKSISNAAKNNIGIELNREIKDTATKITSAIENDRSLINEFGSDLAQLQSGGTVTADKAYAIKKKLEEFSDLIYGSNDPGTNLLQKQISSLTDLVDASLKTAVPAFKTASERFAQFRRLVPESIISGSTPTEISGITVGGLRKSKEKLYDKTKDLIENLTDTGPSSLESKASFNILSKNLDKLSASEKQRVLNGEITEDIFKKLGSPKELLSQIKEASDIANITKLGSMGASPKISKSVIQGIGDVGKSAAFNVANKIGRSTNIPLLKEGIELAGGAAKGTAAVSRALFDLPDEALTRIATSLKESNPNSQLADALIDAISNGDIAKKNAAIFSIIQNPTLRLKFSEPDQEE